MKKVDAENIKDVGGRRLQEEEVFQFRCGPDLSCFNLCCRNLDLFLYPYDVARLRKRLGMSSSDFIGRHTDVVLRPGEHFPVVLLSMADNQEKTCPFLSEEGCGVYPDRPYACRTFPTEHGMRYQEGRQELLHFFKPPGFCRGQDVSHDWTVGTWLKDQEAGPYFAWMKKWSDFLLSFQQDPWKGQGPESQAGRMAFMATYNPDDFREFLFGSSFFKRFRVKGPLKKKLKKSDEELLELGMDWVRFTLFARPSKKFSPRK